MPTENDANTGNSSETPENDQQQGQQQSTTPETGGNGEQQPSTPQEPVKLPDDHPLVKTLAKQKLDLASTRTELTEARAQAAKVTQLEAELQKRPTQEAVDTLQTRYDRLEAFLQAVGGPVSKALDSRTFTKDLFESDRDVSDILKDWNKANPSATSTALGSAAASPANNAPDVNMLLRKAAGR